MWLQAPVEEIDDRGRKHRTTPGKDRGRGCPQGAPISPLLANLYMRRFVLGWKRLGHERRLHARVVNYADDLVICCRGQGEEALAALQSMMQKLKLTVNEAKTRLCRVPDESVDFLGYTIGRCYSPRTGGAYIGTRPSRKSDLAPSDRSDSNVSAFGTCGISLPLTSPTKTTQDRSVRRQLCVSPRHLPTAGRVRSRRGRPGTFFQSIRGAGQGTPGWVARGSLHAGRGSVTSR
jgi:hypothetical protein